MIFKVIKKVIYIFICSVFVSVSSGLLGNNLAYAHDNVSKHQDTKKQLEIINLKKIANDKNPKALYALAKLYEPDYKKSYPLVLRSAKLGYAKSESLLALYYLKGK